MSGGPKYRCLSCKEVLQSTYRHDFVTCSCGRLSVDGGSDYTRLLGHASDRELVKENHEEAQ